MLSVSGLSKRYGEHQALQDVNFELAQGEILAVLGPSGSGKSTLLKLIAGLQTPDAGQVRWDGEPMNSLPVHARGFGYMFQDYALFPHRDVAGNIAFGLEMAGLDQAALDARLAEVLELVGLTGFGAREIASLSGGEQQRVALARALAPQPRLLMLDEPLGSLDRALREELGGALHAILKAAGQSSLYVTHDQEEAFRLGDRVLILNEGRGVQIGSPQALYKAPATRFVAQFLGFDNLFAAELRREDNGWLAETSLGEFALEGDHAAGAATLLLRPDRIELASAGPYRATLERLSFRGRYWELDLRFGDEILRVELNGARPDLSLGEELSLEIGASAIQVLKDG